MPVAAPVIERSNDGYSLCVGRPYAEYNSASVGGHSLTLDFIFIVHKCLLTLTISHHNLSIEALSLNSVLRTSRLEHFVRQFMEMGFKFHITGSNSSLLSHELGTRLTGRYGPLELFHRSLSEYLHFRGCPIPDLTHMTSADKARLQNHLNEYLQLGGIPEPLKYPELQLLRTLFDERTE